MLGACNTHFLLAVLAKEIVDLLAFNKAVQAFIYGLTFLHLKREVVEFLNAVLRSLTALACHAHNCAATEHLVKHLWETTFLELLLQLIKEHVQKLLGVFLNAEVDVTAERIAEGFGAVVTSLAQFEEPEHPL